MDHLGTETAELLREPRHPADLHQITRLPQCRMRSRRATARQAAMQPVCLGHHRGNGVALTAGLMGNLSARISLDVRHDTSPPEGFKATDTSTKFSLVYKVD